MTSIKKRCLRNSGIRLNYAKTAKECRMKYISVIELQKYFIEDWEEKIELLKVGFNWNTIIEHLLKKDINRMEFEKLVRRNGIDGYLLRKYTRRLYKRDYFERCPCPLVIQEVRF